MNINPPDIGARAPQSGAGAGHTRAGSVLPDAVGDEAATGALLAEANAMFQSRVGTAPPVR